MLDISAFYGAARLDMWHTPEKDTRARLLSIISRRYDRRSRKRKGRHDDFVYATQTSFHGFAHLLSQTIHQVTRHTRFVALSIDRSYMSSNVCTAHDISRSGCCLRQVSHETQDTSVPIEQQLILAAFHTILMLQICTTNSTSHETNKHMV